MPPAFLLDKVLPFLPIIVVVVITWVLVSFGYRFVLALLGRAQPVEGGPVTPVGRFVGGALAAVLAPVQQVLALVAMFLVLSSGLFVANHFRLYDDGLVDTTATIVGRTERCLDPGVDEAAALPTAPACGFPMPSGKRVIDALDVTFVGAGGRTIRAAAPLYLVKDGRTASGETFRAAYWPSEPLRLGHHLSDMLLIGPEKLFLAGLVLWGLSRVVKRVRRMLAGRPIEDDGLLGGVRRLFRRRSEPAAAEGVADLVRPDFGLAGARVLAEWGRSGPISDGSRRSTGEARSG